MYNFIFGYVIATLIASFIGSALFAVYRAKLPRYMPLFDRALVSEGVMWSPQEYLAQGPRITVLAQAALTTVAPCRNPTGSFRPVCVTPRKLGLTRGKTGPGPSREKIYEAAIKGGLVLCPIGIMPLVVQEAAFMQEGVSFVIATTTIEFGESEYMFFVTRGLHGAVLDVTAGRPKLQWDLESLWVFLERLPEDELSQ